MKATDLIIDDLVTVKHTHRPPSIEKVYGVGPSCVLIKTNSGIQSFDYEKIEPIPLSEEILENFGFKKENWIDEVHFCYTANDEYYCNCTIAYKIGEKEPFVCIEKYATLRAEKNYSRDFRGYVSYAHELQHILKDLGIEIEFDLHKS